MDSQAATLMRIEAKQDRILAALDTLITSLTDGEEEDQPSLTLDGAPAGRERDTSQSLG